MGYYFTESVIYLNGGINPRTGSIVKISPPAACVLSQICLKTNDKIVRPARLSHSVLAKRTLYSKKTVSNALRQLMTQGLILVDQYSYQEMIGGWSQKSCNEYFPNFKPVLGPTKKGRKSGDVIGVEHNNDDQIDHLKIAFDEYYLHGYEDLWDFKVEYPQLKGNKSESKVMTTPCEYSGPAYESSDNDLPF